MASFGSDVRQLAESGRVRLVTGFAIVAIREVDGRLIVEGETKDGLRTISPVDRIIAATGQRPDLTLTRELRLDLDPWLESVKALGAAHRSQRAFLRRVPPHGHRELSHPEADFYTVGIKSYGRAPTFLLLTGYEQVRSVAAAIAGDIASADTVRLVLPETGVCTVPVSLSGTSSQGCCGGPAPAAVDACCVDDAKAKASGKSGCGCGSTQAIAAMRSDDCRDRRSMSDRKIPAAALWALGLTQIIGYGTLYYSFSILVPSIALELAWPEQWVFGALSASLLVGGLFAPTAGRWADRFGAGRVMTFGSAAAAAALVACAIAPGRVSFVAALMAMELASAFVLYSAAFVAIVQIGSARAQRSITHLTLIAGFASTLFWPLTAALHEYLSWREVYLVFAVINVAVCLPHPCLAGAAVASGGQKRVGDACGHRVGRAIRLPSPRATAAECFCSCLAALRSRVLCCPRSSFTWCR